MRNFVLLVLLLTSAVCARANYAERPEVKEFIRDVAARHGFVEEDLASMFARVRRAEPVLEAIKPPPPKARSWEEYRGIFLNERRIAGGVEFWAKHREALERAEQQFGVPAHYIVAIIGIETLYGRNAGRWRVVEALTTLAFDYPPRAKYFRSELEQYLLLARERNTDVFAVRGSYAGAIGIPQFMPSSTRRYAVDFDGDGAVDLLNSAIDAIGSIANFLKVHGWVTGGEVAMDARVRGDGWRPFADGSVEAKYTLAQLRAAGVEFDGGTDSARAALVELETPERPSEYRVGLRNFYVITRYNRSAFYAAAVHELAEALRKAQGLGR